MLRLLCLLACLAATVTGACEPPFTSVGEGCYYHSTLDIKLGWTEARQYCQSLGSEVDLAAVLDYVCDDFQNLGTYFRLQGSDVAIYFTWIGATGSDDKWFWVDGRSFSTDSSYWYHGQPTWSNGSVVIALYVDDYNHERIFLREFSAITMHKAFICQDFSASLQQ